MISNIVKKNRIHQKLLKLIKIIHHYHLENILSSEVPLRFSLSLLSFEYHCELQLISNDSALIKTIFH